MEMELTPKLVIDKQSDWMVNLLTHNGLTKAQATSTTAKTCINVLMQEDGKALMAEAREQVKMMAETVNSLREDYAELAGKLQGISELLLAVKDAQEEYGTISDEKARTVLALYAALLSLHKKEGANVENAVQNVGYVMYAFLGGQARRDVDYVLQDESKTTRNFRRWERG